MPLRFDVLPYFVAYLVTLVPFYHGALRHLDTTYFEDIGTRTKPGALMLDWGLLFVESCLLLGLAVLLQRPEAFSLLICGLLGFDAAWAFLASLAFAPAGKKHRAEAKWGWINFITALVLAISLLYLASLDPSKPIEFYRWIIVLLLLIARTVCDYGTCWNYYYPTADL
jgi:hypothetical protein